MFWYFKHLKNNIIILATYLVSTQLFFHSVHGNTGIILLVAWSKLNFSMTWDKTLIFWLIFVYDINFLLNDFYVHVFDFSDCWGHQLLPHPRGTELSDRINLKMLIGKRYAIYFLLSITARLWQYCQHNSSSSRIWY